MPTIDYSTKAVYGMVGFGGINKRENSLQNLKKSDYASEGLGFRDNVYKNSENSRVFKNQAS